MLLIAKNLSTFLHNNTNKIRLFFTSNNCKPCEQVKLLLKNDTKTFFTVNVNLDSDIATQFNVLSVPTILVLDGGKVVKQLSGVSQELFEYLEKGK